MSDDLIDDLTRLSPAGAGFSRDALLFEAGRAAAPSARPWKLAVAGLALTQAMTLMALCWRSPTPAVADPPAYVAPAESSAPVPVSTLGYYRAHPELIDAPVAPDGEATPDAPPLRPRTVPDGF